MKKILGILTILLLVFTISCQSEPEAVYEPQPLSYTVIEFELNPDLYAGGCCAGPRAEMCYPCNDPRDPGEDEE
jgi:hypothetical protein